MFACGEVLCNPQVHQNLRLKIVNTFDSKCKCRVHATSLSSNGHAHSKRVHQESVNNQWNMIIKDGHHLLNIFLIIVTNHHHATKN